MSNEPECNQVFVVVHGEAHIPEALATKAEAEAFVDEIGGEYISGPWAVNTTEKGTFEAEVPEYDEEIGRHNPKKLKKIRVDAGEFLRVTLGAQDTGVPSMFLERQKGRWMLAIAHDVGGDTTLVVYIPDDQEAPIEVQAGTHNGGPDAEYTD